MYEIEMIKKAIGVRKGEIGDYAIVPYGVNGVRVERFLEKSLNTKPKYIIDNAFEILANGDKSRIGLDDFSHIYTDDIFVVVTAEDKGLNEAFIDRLVKFVPRSRIINLYDENERWKRKKREEVKEIVSIMNILGL